MATRSNPVNRDLRSIRRQLPIGKGAAERYRASDMTKSTKPGTPRDRHYARLRRTHRDLKAGAASAGRTDVPRTDGPRNAAPPPPEGLVRLYGLHTVRAALDNPRRVIRRMLITRNALERLGSAGGIDPQIVEPKAIAQLCGSDAVHQGVVVECEPLVPKSLDELSQTRLVVLLDQVTDPHNVGAIMRSAVAFGAGALISTARHSPQESGVLAKSASGALEQIDHIVVRNLAEAIATLAAAGFHTIGLDSEAAHRLEDSFSNGPTALVLGAEGKGLRQKTRASVARLARLDLPGSLRSLNVSNAAAVALYAAHRHIETHC